MKYSTDFKRLFHLLNQGETVFGTHEQPRRGGEYETVKALFAQYSSKGQWLYALGRDHLPHTEDSFVEYCQDFGIRFLDLEFDPGNGWIYPEKGKPGTYPNPDQEVICYEEWGTKSKPRPLLHIHKGKYCSGDDLICWKPSVGFPGYKQEAKK